MQILLVVKHIAIPPGNLGPKDNFWVAKKKQLRPIWFTHTSKQ